MISLGTCSLPSPKTLGVELSAITVISRIKFRSWRAAPLHQGLSPCCSQEAQPAQICLSGFSTLQSRMCSLAGIGTSSRIPCFLFGFKYLITNSLHFIPLQPRCFKECPAFPSRTEYFKTNEGSEMEQQTQAHPSSKNYFMQILTHSRDSSLITCVSTPLRSPYHEHTTKLGAAQDRQ